MLQNAQNMGQYAQEKLEQLQTRYTCIEQVRGYGLMIGIELTESGADIVQKCWDKGLRINCTQNTVLRFMPALNVTTDLIDQAIDILDQVLGEMNNQEKNND